MFRRLDFPVKLADFVRRGPCIGDIELSLANWGHFASRYDLTSIPSPQANAVRVAATGSNAIVYEVPLSVGDDEQRDTLAGDGDDEKRAGTAQAVFKAICSDPFAMAADSHTDMYSATELLIWAALQPHAGIVRLDGVARLTGKYAIDVQMPRALGDLRALHSPTRLGAFLSPAWCAANRWSVFGLVADLVGALAHMHMHGIAHRDIKPQNILVESAPAGEGQPPSYRLVLCDFGHAVVVGGEPVDHVVDMQSKWKRLVDIHPRGSGPFRSPAAWERALVGEGSPTPDPISGDLWACALVVCELWLGHRVNGLGCHCEQRADDIARTRFNSYSGEQDAPIVACHEARRPAAVDQEVRGRDEDDDNKDDPNKSSDPDDPGESDESSGDNKEDPDKSSGEDESDDDNKEDPGEYSNSDDPGESDESSGEDESDNDTREDPGESPNSDESSDSSASGSNESDDDDGGALGTRRHTHWNESPTATLAWYRQINRSLCALFVGAGAETLGLAAARSASVFGFVHRPPGGTHAHACGRLLESPTSASLAKSAPTARDEVVRSLIFAMFEYGFSDRAPGSSQQCARVWLRLLEATPKKQHAHHGMPVSVG